jgi:hypothetical protein
MNVPLSDLSEIEMSLILDFLDSEKCHLDRIYLDRVRLHQTNVNGAIKSKYTKIDSYIRVRTTNELQ